MFGDLSDVAMRTTAPTTNSGYGGSQEFDGLRGGGSGIQLEGSVEAWEEWQYMLRKLREYGHTTPAGGGQALLADNVVFNSPITQMRGMGGGGCSLLRWEDERPRNRELRS